MQWGNALCAWSDPVYRADGSLDFEGTIHGLQEAGFASNAFVISGSGGNGYESFQRLRRASEEAKMDTWVLLIPTSEGASSIPYRPDFVAWRKKLGRLSLSCKHFCGVNVNDIDQGISRETFARNYVCQIYRLKQAANPRLQFVPTVCDLDRTAADRLAGWVVGVWCWWVNLEKATGLPSFLKNSKLAANGRFPVYGGVYAHWTSWHKAGNPGTVVFEETLKDACMYSSGVVIWRMPLDPGDPLLNVAKTYVHGGNAVSGKCGSDGGGIPLPSR